MQSFQVSVSPSLGEVSVELAEPSGMTALLVLAHGAGAGMNHPFLKRLAHELAAVHIGSLRFNFPYMEHGRKMPKAAADDMETVGVLLHEAHRLFPAMPLFAGGKSYGGRMTSRYLSQQPCVFVRGIIFYGFPLHPSGKPSVTRAEHLKEVRQPMLFLQGTKDTLAEIALLEQVCATLPDTTLRTFAGADHAFSKTPLNKLSAETRIWIDTLPD